MPEGTPTLVFGCHKNNGAGGTTRDAHVETWHWLKPMREVKAGVPAFCIQLPTDADNSRLTLRSARQQKIHRRRAAFL